MKGEKQMAIAYGGGTNSSKDYFNLTKGITSTPISKGETQNVNNNSTYFNATKGLGNYTYKPTNESTVDDLKAQADAGKAERERKVREYNSSNVQNNVYNDVSSYPEFDASIYESALKEAKKAYQERLKAAQNAYDMQQQRARASADEALRQAYITNRKSNRNMVDYLKRMGYTGGLSETALMGNQAQYEDNRNSIESAYLDNLASLGNTYQNNAFSGYGDYADMIYNINMQKANALNDYNQSKASYYSKMNSGNKSNSSDVANNTVYPSLDVTYKDDEEETDNLSGYTPTAIQRYERQYWK